MLDRFFELSGRGTTVGREVRGGITTFMAMAYIILLNPIILGGAQDVTGAKLTIVAAHHVDRAGGGDLHAAHGRRSATRRWRWPPGSG